MTIDTDALLALKSLVKACEDEFTSELTEVGVAFDVGDAPIPEDDDEPVMAGISGSPVCSITFGHVRRARTAITALAPAFAAAEALSAENARLREALTAVCGQSFRTYRARNGRQISIECDDGEAAEIVPSDAMDLARAALNQEPTP